MKYDCYFMLKTLFVLEIFTLSWLFGYVEKRLDKKTNVNFKIRQQIITIHILPNISRSKGNQTRKFEQLTECYMRNIFFQNSEAKCGEEACSRPFYKKSKLSKWNAWNVIKFAFIVCPSWGLPKYIKRKIWPLTFSLYKAFLENKKEVWN